MSEESNALSGALAGAATAAIANWARYEDGQDRRLRETRHDARDALNAILDYRSRGEQIRARLPVVEDAQVGLAIANPAPAQPVLVPGTVPTIRPDLFSAAVSEVSDYNWPPRHGQYDEKGMVLAAGDMSSLFLALTYEEVRAFVIGLTQKDKPIGGQSVQIYLMANALTQVVESLNLTHQQYKDAWLRLFTNSSGGGGSLDLHNSVGNPPTLASKDAGVTSITALGLPDLVGAQYPHQNTDRSNRWRIRIGGANIASDSVIATFQFGSSWTKNGQPWVPAVALTDGRFIVSATTPSSWTIKNLVQLSLNTDYDIGFGVVG